MKYLLKLFTLLIFTSFTKNSFAQYSKRESNEIIKVLNSLSSKDPKINVIFNFRNDTLLLPRNFSTYNYYYDFLISTEDSSHSFAKNSFFTEKEKNQFKNKLLFDTTNNLTKIDKNSKIKIYSNAVKKYRELGVNEIAKPMFFRNFTLCLIISYRDQGLVSFILKKSKNKWRFYQEYACFVN
jgi:hypothetical protein